MGLSSFFCLVLSVARGIPVSIKSFLALAASLISMVRLVKLWSHKAMIDVNTALTHEKLVSINTSVKESLVSSITWYHRMPCAMEDLVLKKTCCQ